MKTSPTQRSLHKLRDEGYFSAVVERWNPYARIRQDLWGFVDIIALKGSELLLVQSTSGSNVSARIEKIRANETAGLILETTSARVIVHGWRKVGERGKRKVWECREVGVSR